MMPLACLCQMSNLAYLAQVAGEVRLGLAALVKLGNLHVQTISAVAQDPT